MKANKFLITAILVITIGAPIARFCGGHQIAAVDDTDG